MTVLEILEAARERVAKGWTQGASRTTALDGRTLYCASGAIGSVVGGHQYALRAGSPRCPACAATIALAAAVPTDAIATWNDALGRTQADVLSAYDKAIALVRDAAPAAPKEP